MKKILIACLMAGLAALSAQENKGAVKAEQKTASQTEQQAKKDDRNSEKKTVQETTEKKAAKNDPKHDGFFSPNWKFALFQLGIWKNCQLLDSSTIALISLGLPVQCYNGSNYGLAAAGLMQINDDNNYGVATGLAQINENNNYGLAAAGLIQMNDDNNYGVATGLMQINNDNNYGLAAAGLAQKNNDNNYGIAIGLGQGNKNNYGLAAAGLMQINENNYGIAIGLGLGQGNKENNYGVAVGGLVQLSENNAGTSTGIWNCIPKKNTGLQIGVLNTASEADEKENSCQIGLINITGGKGKVVQFGLFNYAKDGILPFTLFVNFPKYNKK